jgi:hypothetical protein
VLAGLQREPPDPVPQERQVVHVTQRALHPAQDGDVPGSRARSGLAQAFLGVAPLLDGDPGLVEPQVLGCCGRVAHGAPRGRAQIGLHGQPVLDRGRIAQQPAAQATRGLGKVPQHARALRARARGRSGRA